VKEVEWGAYVGLALCGFPAGTETTPTASLQELRDRRPDSLEVRLALAAVLAEQGAGDGARVELEAVLAESPEHLGALWALAQLETGAGRADAAAGLEASARQLAGHPPDGLELPERGRFSVLARSLSDAAAELREAAGRGDADAVEVARRRVGFACRDCHQRFRPDAPDLPDVFR